MCKQNIRKPKKIQARTIRAAIRQIHGSVQTFARVGGVSRRTVYLVINGETVSRGIATAIADCMGLTPHDIWPGIYSAPLSPAPDAYTPGL